MALALVTAAGLAAQGRGSGRGENLAKGTDITSSRNFDMTAVDRGKAKFAMLCASCHGEDARGGSGKTEIDLVRSVLVLDDVGGKELGEFLKTGRPARKMPAFTLPPGEVSDIAAFLHHNVTVASERGAYKYLDVLVGDAKAGEAYFNGAGGCAKCHSPTGDLAGIGAKYSPLDLQSRFLMPKSRKAVMATVTTVAGEKVSGRVLVINNFEVSIQDAEGKTHKWPADSVKVESEDPLEAHRELLPKYTDADMHNMFAYLVTLK